MRMLLRDLTPGQEYAISFRSNNGDGNVSEWSQVQRFTTTNDTVRPGSVQNLSWYDSGDAFIGQWDKVIVDEYNKPLTDFKHYRCNVSDGTVGADFYVTGEKFELSKEMNLATFGTAKTSLTLKVWAVDTVGNESPMVAQISVNPLDPPTPWWPVVSSFMGSLLVEWNGKDSSFFNMPSNFNYVEVHISTISNFTPTPSTFAARIVDAGSASKVLIPQLPYSTIYYVRLVAVNLIGRRSGPSEQRSGQAQRLSGLDIQNGQISKDQINFTARDIGGANAFYATTQPTSGMVMGDLWYDTDNGYEVWRYTGVNWVTAPEVGVISGSKIIAGTVTADAVGTNLLIANRANIADAIIDELHVKSVNAASIKTGSISADQRIIAGPEFDVHSEMTSQGFYVMVPGANWTPEDPTDLAPAVKMGTGDGDTFSITDPNQPDRTLASISGGGFASFQGLSVEGDPMIAGRLLIADRLKDLGGKIVGRGSMVIKGLEPAGNAGIRSEYGIGQFTFPVEAGNAYLIKSRLDFWYVNVGGEARQYFRVQKDARTPTQVTNNELPTPVTNSSTFINYTAHSGLVNGWRQNPEVVFMFYPDWTGYASIGMSMLLAGPPAAESVIKVAENSTLTMESVDFGRAPSATSRIHNQGGTPYAYVQPPPPPPPPVVNYYQEHRFNWVRSYKGDNGYMTNTDGKAYQGQSPYAPNGNQIGFFGWSQVDWASMTAGANITRIVLYLYYAHWYYNSGGTARIGFHGQWGDPGGASRNFNSTNGLFDSGGWPKPGGRELDITGWRGWFQNGGFRGISLGPGNNGYTTYGYATDAVIKIWYSR